MEVPEEEIEFKNFNKQAHSSIKKKWTVNLIICCLTVATGSLQFGYNIASLNSVTDILKDHIKNDTFLFAEYHNKSRLFVLNEGYIKGNETKLNDAKVEYESRKTEYLESIFSLDMEYKQRLEERKQAKEKEIREKFNMTIDEYFEYLTNRLEEKKTLLESYRPKLAEGKKKVEKYVDYIWILTNTLFVIGGMTGTFSSKFILDILGRKKGILLHHLVSIIASILVLSSFFFHSPVCLVISRFLYGVQGGMSCTLIPTYLAEISPTALRGQTGVIHQLFITIGIVVAQLLGLRQILGSFSVWGYFIALPIIPAVLGSIVLLFLLPESPSALLSKNDQEGARLSLKLLRNTQDIDDEIDELNMTAKSSNNQETISVIGLFKDRDCRWPLITSLIIHFTQQMSGINAVFYYSSFIFKDAGIEDEYIQYAILSTGVVNVITTIVCVFLIDKLGRKPLLIFPMAVILLDFVGLILSMQFKENNVILSYMCIVFILLFIISFAISLGPIPFIYTAECFRQNARSSAMAVCTLVNWTSGLMLTLLFPILLQLINQYVFLIFAIVVGFALIVIVKKVPETKGKTTEEIIAKFNLDRGQL